MKRDDGPIAATHVPVVPLQQKRGLLLGTGGWTAVIVPISGTVTLDGAPVPHGNVSFQPLQPGGVGSGAAITDGAFSISEEQGLPVGKYQVMVYASDPSVADLPPGGLPGDGAADEIFRRSSRPRHNLSATIGVWRARAPRLSRKSPASPPEESPSTSSTASYGVASRSTNCSPAKAPIRALQRLLTATAR